MKPKFNIEEVQSKHLNVNWAAVGGAALAGFGIGLIVT